MANTIESYLDMMWLEKGLSTHTLNAYASDLKFFQRWLKEWQEGLTLETVDEKNIRIYCKQLENSIGVPVAVLVYYPACVASIVGYIVVGALMLILCLK